MSDFKSEIVKAIRENADPSSNCLKSNNSFLYKTISLSSLTAFCIVLFLYSTSSLFTSSIPTVPYAKITTPSPGSITGEHVKVIGETRNIESGQYIWLAVDKPRLGLCWPKAPRLPSNTGFSTEIYEGGPEEPFTLSVYAVNKTVSDHWQDWLNKERDGGLPMPPDNRRLVSVRLIKKVPT
ncbi:hypothetical protein [Desulfospira joergensenii]|uniref:hypothetical protein n=1 Tax=Desulfospira joergensenii TaxID=53329 RepID=UPI000A02A4A5|nr:hypothetical protein [Desulfospira joergensenii]